jgi:hypothetical protein
MNKHKQEYANTTTFSGMEWYVTWDIASGVIWNKSAIINFKQIYQREAGEFTKV